MTQNGTVRASRRRSGALALAVLLVACGDDADITMDAQAPSSSLDGGSCVWELDDLLSQVGATTPERSDCGTFNGAQTEQVSTALECLLETPDGDAAQFTVNNCIDCSIPSTYVLTPKGDLFHIRMEADQFGDDRREVMVERCDNLIDVADEGVRCVNASVLYSCTDALQDAA